jgi:hypothetical protein
VAPVLRFVLSCWKCCSEKVQSDVYRVAFSDKKQTRRVRWQTGKEIKVTKERVAAAVAAASPAVVKAAVDRAAAVRVVADPVVDSVAAVEAVATAKR